MEPESTLPVLFRLDDESLKGWINMVRDAFYRGTALVLLVLLLPLFLLVALLVKFDSAGPVLFRQERIGKGFCPFLIYKFRTMVENAAAKGGAITVASDPRVTRVGRFLRKTKLDELPQLVNVLKGEMSLVGPRPEVREYVELYPGDYGEILTVKPGITGPDAISYCDEGAILAQAADPEGDYRKRILPDKIRLGKEYIQRSSFLFDLGVLLKTSMRLIR